MSGASAGHVARVLAPLRAAPPPNLALCWLNRQHGSLPRRQSGSAASRPLAARQNDACDARLGLSKPQISSKRSSPRVGRLACNGA
jgi:hypothetical protein